MKGLFVCFGALSLKSTAMVIAGLSVHLTTQRYYLSRALAAPLFRKAKPIAQLC